MLPRRPHLAPLLLLGLGLACRNPALEPPDGSPAAIRCPLSTELRFRWFGYVSVEEAHRLVPPALYERQRKDAPTCRAPLPDCEEGDGGIDLGDVNLALEHPDVTANWPGTGERAFTTDPVFADELAFEMEAKDRGTIVLAHNCDRSGCNPPPPGVVELARTLIRVVDRIRSCP